MRTGAWWGLVAVVSLAGCAQGADAADGDLGPDVPVDAAVEGGGDASPGAAGSDGSVAPVVEGGGSAEASVDAGPPDAAAPDARTDASVADASAVDASVDAGADAARDAAPDAGSDAGCVGRVVVNEVRCESASSPLDQFVELYNPTSCPVSLSGYRVAYREAHGTNETSLWVGAAGQSIAAGSYFLLAGSDFVGTRDGALQAALLSRSGGGIGVYGGGAVVDSLGWGSATNAFVRTSPAVGPSIAQSLARSPNGSDSGNNYVDFVASQAQTPRAAN